MVKTLYFKYGSRITSGAAEVFYDRVLADEHLKPFFRDIDEGRLREHMADMLSVITGGPNIYSGKDMKTAHQEFSITRDDFNRVASHMMHSLIAMGLSREDVDLVMVEIAKSAKDVISA